MGSRTLAALVLVATAAAAGFGAAPIDAALATPRRAAARADSAVPNDNRVAAGRLRAGVLELALETRVVGWRPDPAVDTLVTVHAFAEAGGAARVPGPLVRVASGTRVRLTLRHGAGDSTLVVRGLRGGAAPDDTIQVRPGEVRAIEFVAGAPGTYLYWGATTAVRAMRDRPPRDSQLAGAIVVDPAGTVPDPAERVLVLTLISDRPGAPDHDRLWETAVNGRSWPHTERLRYFVGDTVRWRLLNASDRSHPMHLHGFHFTVRSKGTGLTDTTYVPERARLAVTELLNPGHTTRIDWVPVRAGTWLMHCHMIPHVTPYPERAHGATHDPARHALEGMAGMVMGIVTEERRRAPAPTLASAGDRLRLLVQEQRRSGDSLTRRGYVLQRGAEPARDSIESPSSPLVLRRGEPARITVVNRMRTPTTVHWHGLEIEAVFDGVAGFGRTGARVAPLVAPGDSFTVTITPPRAGTYMYHTHMDEGDELASGLHGVLLVTDPAAPLDPATDHTFLLSRTIDAGSAGPAVNGRRSPPPLELAAGRTHRFRLVHIRPAAPLFVSLVSGNDTLRWTPVAKDGADLPPALRVARPARQLMGVGETYDFEFTPTGPTTATLVFQLAPTPATAQLRQEIRVVAAK